MARKNLICCFLILLLCFPLLSAFAEEEAVPEEKYWYCLSCGSPASGDACPYCGETMIFDVERFDFDEDYLCPNCHKPLFPDSEAYRKFEQQRNQKTEEIKQKFSNIIVENL